MKKLSLLISLVVSFLTVSAFRIEYGRDIIISKPVYDNLYVAGGSITINAPIYGDLIITGGNITINDTVTNDILLAGGTSILNGFVGGDIRCAGGSVHVDRDVTGDVIIASGSLNINKGVTIGNLLIAGGNITVDGNVNGEIRGSFGSLNLNGTVEKNIDCRGGKITINGIINGISVLAAREIVIGNDAGFNRNVRYWNNKGKLDFKQSLKNANATFDPSLRISTGEWYYLGAETILMLLWYLGMALVMILLTEYLFSATMKNAANSVYNKTLPSLGFGFLFFIACPIAAIIALVSIIGIPLGLIMIFSYIILMLLATVITSVVAANWYNNQYEKNWNYWRICCAAFGIFILLKLLLLMPFVGWVILTLISCIAFGGIILNVNWRGRKKIILGDTSV